MSAGSNPGADVVNFRFHITDFNASLQSSSVVSVENDQMVPGGNKGAIVMEKIEKIKTLQTKYKDLLNRCCDSQKTQCLRDINRTYEYLQLIEGKLSWSNVEDSSDCDQATYADEFQVDWEIRNDLYDEEQEIFEWLEYHYEGYECPVEIVEKRQAMLEQCRAALDDVNKYLAGSRGCKMRVMEELKRLIGDDDDDCDDDCDCDDCDDTQWGVCVGCGWNKRIYNNCNMCVECFT